VLDWFKGTGAPWVGYAIHITKHWDCSIHLGKMTKVGNSTAMIVEGSWGNAPYFGKIIKRKD
jgi:hypothetical protein